MKVRAGSLDTPESVEQLRRSIALLAPETPVWNREEACEVLEALGAALRCRQPAG